MAEYTRITDHHTQERLKARYTAEIKDLQAIGFRHLAYCLEDHGPYSAFRHSLEALLMTFQRENFRIKWPFRMTLANVLLATDNPPAIALCLGLGVKLYSIFEDGSMTITVNFNTYATPNPGSRITRLEAPGPIAQAWALHQEAVHQKSGQIDFLSPTMNFGDYVMMSGFEENPG
jgi:hypothetical protein